MDSTSLEKAAVTDSQLFSRGRESILVVDDEPMILEVTTSSLMMNDYYVCKASNVQEARDLLLQHEFNLVLSDIRMPRETGVDLMRYCHDNNYDIPFILMSGFADAELIIEALNLGASFFLSKPFSLETLEKQVDSVLSRQRYELLRRKMLEHLKYSKQILEHKVKERTCQLERTQDAIGMVLSGMAETRDPETGEHLARTRGYVQCLGGAMLQKGLHVDELKDGALGVVARATILHDVGKVGVPDSILLKPGKLTPEEFEVMKKHTLYGSYVFDRAIEFCGEDPFLLVARHIARSHHERWDGTGYPDGLAGETIPLAARIMAVADVYDALINKRCYKEAFKREDAESMVIAGSGTQFDPDIIKMFMESRDTFARIAEKFCDLHLGIDSSNKGMLHLYDD